MRFVWPLAWTFLLGAVVVVGGCVFVYVRTTPRCIIRSKHAVEGLSADGRLLLGLPDPRFLGHAGVEPVVVWDTVTGARRHTFLQEATASDRYAVHDGLVMYHSGRGTLHFIEWQTAAVHELALGPARPLQQIALSPQGKWLHLSYDDQPAHELIDVSGRRVVMRSDASFVRLNWDERTAFVCELGQPPTLWDLVAGQPIGMIGAAREGLVVDELVVSPDGAYAGFWSVVGDQQPAVNEREINSKFTLEIWDLQTLTKQFERSYRAEGCHALFVPGSKHVLVTSIGQDNLVELLEVRTGRRILIRDRMALEQHQFAPDGSVLLVSAGLGGESSAWDIASGAQLWTKRHANSNSAYFVANTNVLVVAEDGKPLELLDARSGEHFASVSSASALAWRDIQATPDGRHVLFCGARRDPLSFWERQWRRLAPKEQPSANWTALLIETSSGRERLRLNIPEAISTRVSDDGSTFVSVSFDKNAQQSIIRVWNVDAKQAWIWALLAALGTLASAAALMIAVSRWRRRK